MVETLINKIAAGIILYQPESNRLKLNIKKISAQVDHIYLYNNGTTSALLKELEKNSKICILGNGDNVGIATAMNQIMKKAKVNGEDWVITYDQDSISGTNLLTEYKKVINNDSKVAILCPQVIDERRKYMKPLKNDKIEDVSNCITSGSCTRIAAWDEIGGFDDYLFIDLVDNDFCKRLKLNDWKIIRLNNVILNQQFGNIEEKNQSIVRIVMGISDFIKNKLHMDDLATNIGKLSYTKQVSPMRVYYTNRNIIYLNKKFSDYGGIGYENYNCNSYFGFQICFNLASLLRGKDKIQIIRAIISGMRDGINSNN